LKLSIRKDPTKISSYYISGDGYKVVGGQRWLVKEEDLPEIWHYSRFVSREDAKRTLEKLEEKDAVDLNLIKAFYKSS